MGESTRLYIYSFDQPEVEDKGEEFIKTETEQQKTRKERMLKIYEEHKKQQEGFQNSVQEERSGINGLNNDGEVRNSLNSSSSQLSEEEIKQYGLKIGQPINYSALKDKKDLTDPQKAVIRKAEGSIRRMEKLTRELEGIHSKQAKMLDLTDGQQQRYYRLETELQGIRETLEAQEENVRNMILNGEEEDNYDEIKAKRSFFKNWENQEYDDEFYDRSKQNKFNKNKRKNKITKADIREGDTYENVRKRLDLKMKERDSLMARLIEIDYESKQKEKNKEEDEFEVFMNSNDKEIKNDEKEFVKNRMNLAKDEIDK